MKVYLAGPIAGCTDAEAFDWRNTVTKVLAENHISVFDPMSRDFRDKGAKENMETIVEGDLAEIDESDVLLANVWKISAGTSMEIFYASHVKNIPVIAVMPEKDMVPIWIRYHATVVRDMGKAIELIKILGDTPCPI